MKGKVIKSKDKKSKKGKEKTCPGCNGSGQSSSGLLYWCDICNGTGIIEVNK